MLCICIVITEGHWIHLPTSLPGLESLQLTFWWCFFLWFWVIRLKHVNRVYIVAVRWCKNDKYIHTFMMYVYIYKKMFCLQPHVHCTCVFSVFFLWLYVDKENTCHHIHAHDQTMTSFLALDVSLTFQKKQQLPSWKLTKGISEDDIVHSPQKWGYRLVPRRVKHVKLWMFDFCHLESCIWNISTKCWDQLVNSIIYMFEIYCLYQLNICEHSSLLNCLYQLKPRCEASLCNAKRK